MKKMRFLSTIAMILGATLIFASCSFENGYDKLKKYVNIHGNTYALTFNSDYDSQTQNYTYMNYQITPSISDFTDLPRALHAGDKVIVDIQYLTEDDFMPINSWIISAASVDGWWTTVSDGKAIFTNDPAAGFCSSAQIVFDITNTANSTDPSDYKLAMNCPVRPGETGEIGEHADALYLKAIIKIKVELN